MYSTLLQIFIIAHKKDHLSAFRRAMLWSFHMIALGAPKHSSWRPKGIICGIRSYDVEICQQKGSKHECSLLDLVDNF